MRVGPQKSIYLDVCTAQGVLGKSHRPPKVGVRRTKI